MFCLASRKMSRLPGLLCAALPYPAETETESVAGKNGVMRRPSSPVISIPSEELPCLRDSDIGGFSNMTMMNRGMSGMSWMSTLFRINHRDSQAARLRISWDGSGSHTSPMEKGDSEKV